ncbi:hypothetical protein J4N42_04305 [Vibrio sp. SCSIO 43135]|uniref:hypothetical protein n=1 Tax=Vibrio sp. SCSIO 43135 TaxID=2819096 RepID=UPI0020759078|nr:hypothetical protein [Vibrio sp. SCSIO 43135]USD41952.1 hypothetical protein J4N42_04305 [Vibrio sp. SCSIO 43135]
MKLLASITTTILITGVIWSAVTLQPATAETAPATALNNLTSSLNNEKPDSVTGVSKTIHLQELPALWHQFYTDNPTIPSDVNTLIVIYQQIDKSFTHAKVTIGYAQDAKQSLSVQLSVDSTRQVLLPKGQHSASVLEQAWHQIDFHQPISAVVEVHYLNQHGLPDSSEVSVYYEQ